MNNKYPKLTNRQRAVESAASLFLHKGYHVSSMNDVVAESGVSKSNIYYHFKSKEDLTLEVIDWRIAQYEQVFTDLMNSNATASCKLDLMFERFYSDMLDRRCAGGSPLLSLWIQASSETNLVRQRIRTFFQNFVPVMERLLETGINEGVWSRHIPIQSTALMLVSMIEGAFMMAEVRHDPELLRHIKQSFMALLKAV